jgi:hypothetical protein
VTDRFVPALAASRLADVVVSHGGQGTVQTALAAGAPLVGVGPQMEQQINLDHVMDAGAGIRIQRQRWRAPAIRHAVRTVLADPRYRRHAEALAGTIGTMDGAATAAERMWDFVRGMAQLGVALALRARGGAHRNWGLAAAVALSLALQLGALWLPPLRSLLGTEMLSPAQVAACATAAAIPGLVTLATARVRRDTSQVR